MRLTDLRDLIIQKREKEAFKDSSSSILQGNSRDTNLMHIIKYGVRVVYDSVFRSRA